MSRRELFVYYKVRSADEEAAAAEVRALHRDLSASIPALVARLLRRPSEQAGLQTWMETYALADGRGAAGIEPDLQAAIESHAARALTHVVGGRHVEVFIECA